MEFMKPEFVVPMVILDLAGIISNCCFLYCIKCRAAPYNAIDIVQILKTVFVILGAMICVWLELLTCTTKPCAGIKCILDDVFYHSSCLTFLTVAYIRQKVCECKGRASVLVTTGYAIKAFFICLIPVFLFNAATLSLMTTSHSAQENQSLSHDVPLLLHDSYVAFEMCRIIILILLPLVVGSVLYARIFQVVWNTSKTVGGNSGQRTRDPSKLITQSVIILLSITCTIWTVFIATKVVSLFIHIDERFFIYWKVICIIAHPFGEGLLHPSARRPVRRMQEWIHERSVRRVDPCYSPTMTLDQDSMIDTDVRSMAEQLPTLMEERSSIIPPKASIPDTKAGLQNINTRTPKRRPSIRHTRPSILVRNAAYIGLECRDMSSVINIYRGRKESVDKLKRELKNVEELTTEHAAARRLSRCLRLSSMDEFSEDEVYERYREMYSRRGSSKYSDKSNKSNRSSVFLPEYKGLAYASNCGIRERKETDTSSVIMSPSRKRWQKLYTTARSAKRFSKLRSHTARIDEEVVKRSLQSCSGPQELDTVPKPAKDSMPTMQEDQACTSRVFEQSTARQDLNRLFGVHRGSLDNHLPTYSRPISGISTKKRSVSCVNNAWQKACEEHLKSSPRKISVSFISGANFGGESTSTTKPTSRSLSYDAKECYNYRNHTEQQRQQLSRYSYGNNRYWRHSQEKIKVARWLLEKDTSKEECIEKLLEMKDYF